MTPKLSRRTVLKGLLGGAAVSVGLPAFEVFLDEHGEAYAAGGGLPVRFGIFTWGNGMLPDRWVPAAVGEKWTPSEQLAPLADVADLVTVVTGMSVGVVNSVPHGSGPAGFLSGAPLLMTDGDDGTFAGPSLDQRIAQVLGKETRFKSLECGAYPGDGLSFNGPHSRNPPEPSPHKLFERLFGAGFTAPGDEPILDPTIALRRSVLDAVTLDAERLRKRLGKADADRLEQHLDGIRELEKQLAFLEADPPDLAACAVPGVPPEEWPEPEAVPPIVEKSLAVSKVLAMALACDQTRVFSHALTAPISNHLFPGASAGHHQLTHDEPGDQPEVNEITKVCMTAFRDLVATLASVQEGSGTLLDHMVLLGTSEVSLGKTHSLEEYPILLAGSACGKLRTGYHYRSGSGENASKVVVSIGRALGLGWNEYGEGDAYADEGLLEIEL